MNYLEPSVPKTAKEVFKNMAQVALKKLKPIELVCISKQIVKLNGKDEYEKTMVKCHVKPETPCSLHPKSLFYKTKNKCVSCAAAEGRLNRKK